MRKKGTFSSLSKAGALLEGEKQRLKKTKTPDVYTATYMYSILGLSEGESWMKMTCKKKEDCSLQNKIQEKQEDNAGKQHKVTFIDINYNKRQKPH